MPHYDNKTRFTNFFDIENEDEDITKATMVKGVPENY